MFPRHLLARPRMGAGLLLFVICYLLTSLQGTTQQQQPLRSPCPRAYKISTNYHYRQTLHFICLQRRPNSRPQLDVIQYNNLQTVVSIPITEMDTNQMANFVDDEGTLRILVAVPDRINGTSMYSIDANGRYLNETHTVNTQLVSTMSIWKLELNWEWHLATANQPYFDRSMLDAGTRIMRKPLPDIGAMITIHSWRMSYFDKYQTITLPFDGYVNKLEPMHINDQEFLIVAMESYKHADLAHDSGHQHQAQLKSTRTDSMIYKLDFSDGTLNWVRYQYLGTKQAIDVSSFVITHRSSLQRDYYIAIVGQSEPNFYGPSSQQYQTNGDSSNTGHGLIIYKYLGDRFIKTHSIAAPGITKIDTLSYGSGDNYVIIAVMSGWSRQVSLYLFDGLNLNPAPAPANLPGMTPLAYPQHQQQQPSPPMGRYQRTMNSDGFRLFEMPPMVDLGNGTMKRTLDESVSQSINAMPALVVSSIQETEDDAYGNAVENATVNQDTKDVLYQLPINEMIAESEAKFGADQQQHSSASNSATYTKRNFISGMAQDQQQQQQQDLLGWCKSTISSILADSFEPTARKLVALPRVDQVRPIELHGNLIIEGNLHISNLLYANRIEDSSMRNAAFNQVPMDFSQTFEAIERTHSNIDQVKRRVDQILVDDGTIQEVYAPLKFDKIVFECMNHNNIDPRFAQQLPFMSAVSCPRVGELRTTLLNTRDVSDIQKQALLSGRSMRIRQDIRFEHLVLRGRTSILDSLNGIQVDEIVFKQGHSTGPVTGHKNLRSGLYSSANLIVDSWNGARVDRQTFLTSSGEQRIEADLRFNHAIIDGIPSPQGLTNGNSSARIEVLNGLHLDAHLEQIARADRLNQFEAPVAFDELIIQGPTHFSAGSLLSSVDIEDVWRSAMFKHAHQNISAPMDFAGDVHISYGGDLFVDQLINGVLIRPDNVMMRNRNYELPNPFVFEGDLNVRLLQVEKHLNGVQVLQNMETGRSELAILYDGGRQEISGDKIFNDVRLAGQTHIGGTINGHLNLTQLYSLVRNNGEPFRFGSVRIQGHDVRIADQANFHVSAFVNGVQVDNICRLANRLAQSSGEQYQRLRFDQPVAFDSLHCASINGFSDLSRSFLMKRGQQRVAGTLRLMNGVIFNSTVNIGRTFNNLNVASMSQAIKQVINESQTGHKDFFCDLHVDELFANSINELPLSQVFVAKSDYPQTISAPMLFDHLDIENVLVVGQDLFVRSFNGLNVSDIIANTLQYDAPQVIYNHVELEHLHLLPGANLITKSLNSHDMRQVYSDAVLIDLPQQILAPKVFTGQVDFVDRVFLRFGLDGLTEDELKFILLLQSDELIEDDLEFNNDVTVMKSLEIQTGIINDVDVNMFVTSMLSENRQNGLRVLGNSSLRFKDVKLNNLVVTGTIQGLDLSKEALLMSDNKNGSYNNNLHEQQIYLANQRIFDNLYNNQKQQDFRVQTKYLDNAYSGMCHIHSCPTTTPYMPSNVAFQPRPQTTPAPPPRPHQVVVSPPQVPYSPVPWNLTYRPAPNHLPMAQPLVSNAGQPTGQVLMQGQPLIKAPIFVPRPMNLLMNTTPVGPVWRPLGPIDQQLPYRVQTNATNIKYDQARDNGQLVLVDPKYSEYVAMMKAKAIRELATRINRYLTLSFYYEIVQKHPLLGPVLHAAQNPILNEEGNAWLLFKATVKRGEPCLQRGQKIEVMAEKRHKGHLPSFTVSSHIQETSNPALVESLVVGQSHYVFISDIYPEGPSETVSQVLVYIWDYTSGMYDLKQRIVIDGWPTALKAFVVNQLGCIALANPRVVQSNHSGAPLLYCQQAPMSEFNTRTILPLHNIFDLDIVVPPTGNQIIVAALAQQHTEQVGDLLVSSYDMQTRLISNIAMRRTARPLKLRFVKQQVVGDRVLLIVSEGITSNDAAQATTRIFALHLGGRRQMGTMGESHLVENQIIRDNQFTDIQSVLLDSRNSMIFLQSTHSISIYAPVESRAAGGLGANAAAECEPMFALIQRLPTKGANKFLVFNNNNLRPSGPSAPQDHTLVLSRDDCEHQKYSTMILKPRFR